MVSKFSRLNSELLYACGELRYGFYLVPGMRIDPSKGKLRGGHNRKETPSSHNIGVYDRRVLFPGLSGELTSRRITRTKFRAPKCTYTPR